MELLRILRGFAESFGLRRFAEALHLRRFAEALRLHVLTGFFVEALQVLGELVEVLLEESMRPLYWRGCC